MERYKESSDIDIAVFGSAAKGKALTSKSYRDFAGQIYAFDDYHPERQRRICPTGYRRFFAPLRMTLA